MFVDFYSLQRDLAVRNILLSSNYDPKISDFGMSRIIVSEQSVATTQSYVGPVKVFTWL